MVKELAAIDAVIARSEAAITEVQSAGRRVSSQRPMVCRPILTGIVMVGLTVVTASARAMPASRKRTPP